jgi:hypothetical protein
MSITQQKNATTRPKQLWKLALFDWKKSTTPALRGRTMCKDMDLVYTNHIFSWLCWWPKWTNFYEIVTCSSCNASFRNDFRGTAVNNFWLCSKLEHTQSKKCGSNYLHDLHLIYMYVWSQPRCTNVQCMGNNLKKIVGMILTIVKVGFSMHLQVMNPDWALKLKSAYSEWYPMRKHCPAFVTTNITYSKVLICDSWRRRQRTHILLCHHRTIAAHRHLTICWFVLFDECPSAPVHSILCWS